MAYLFFDTETTGIPKRRGGKTYDHKNLEHFAGARIVQICWMITKGKTFDLLDEKCCIVKPDGFVIPEVTSKIHGIYQAEALSEGRELKEVLEMLEEAVNKYGVKKVVAHNVEFDINILLSEIYRGGVFRNLYESMSSMSQKCTMKAGKYVCKLESRFKNSYKYPTLKELYEFLFHTPIDTSKTHQADFDTKICLQCFRELLRLEKESKLNRT
uniref:Exonuclease domain-containing protein n=1 Tax=viral metagenome TaxID=1070528 RepID=A0A6C0KC11_9ZZZZ